VLVVANPANTNCLLLKMNAPSIPAENFTCLTFLDHNRARAQLSMKAKVPIETISRVAIFGNHSATQVPDAFNARVKTAKGEESLAKMINDDTYLKTAFIKTVQQRGKAIIDARKQSSAMSAANAIADHVRTWLVTGTAPGDTVSMGVYTSQSWYGVKKGLIFSFPIRIQKKGEWIVDESFKLDGDMQKLLAATQKELEEERDEAMEAVKLQSKL
jgi:malate dehydrogenase